MSSYLLFIAIGLIVGLIAFFIISKLVRAQIIAEAEEEAKDLVSAAKQNLDEVVGELKREYEDRKIIALDNLEKELEPRWNKLERSKETLLEKQSDLEENFSKNQRAWQSQSDRLKNREKLVDKNKVNFEKIKTKKSELTQKYINKLLDHSKCSKNEIITELASTNKENTAVRMNKWAQDFEQECIADADKEAKRVVHMAINRFARPYCAERGISYINLVNEKTRKRVFVDDKKYIKQIEELCGVDLIYKEDMNSISASGFDPVRRELARSSMERLIKERRIDEKSVKTLVHKAKKSLFKKIKTDGIKVTKSLRLKPFHPEVTNMLGALKYRYSFSQNQHFHCEEAGYLTGLLATELDLPQKDARRIGLLHDIGKAMDHSIDGGHAVIGADFIQKHGEEERIVHAVRAHHFDEQPNTDLAYLVIAGDALSGARPGARRSTTDSYMQKLGQLEKIGNSFKEVQDTFIMAAGREVRLIVDSKKVSDQKAVDLSREVARRIEDECNYPGLIKVTIVRKIHSVDYAR